MHMSQVILSAVFLEKLLQTPLYIVAKNYKS